MRLRLRRHDDGSTLEAIAVQTHELDGYPKYLPDDVRSFIVDVEALGAWVAVDGEQVVGHVALHRSSSPGMMELAVAATGLEEEGIAVVARLLVSPAARRQGIGRALLEKATAEARRIGRRAVLDVVDDHKAAIALYDRVGWTRVGEVHWNLPGDLPLHEFVYVSPDPAGARKSSRRRLTSSGASHCIQWPGPSTRS